MPKETSLKIQTMSKQLVNDKNDVVIGIATPAAQGLAAATKDIPVIMGLSQTLLGPNWLRISSIQKAMLLVPLTKCRLSKQ